METRGARDIITLLSPFGIAPKRAVRFFKIYGRDAADIIRQHPYRLCEVRGIGFKTADEIAKSVGFDPCGEERIDAALLHVLKEAENGGKSVSRTPGISASPRRCWLAKCIELLETREITERMVSCCAAESSLNRNEITLVSESSLPLFDGQSGGTGRYAGAGTHPPGRYTVFACRSWTPRSTRIERKLGVTPSASEQKKAVKTCLCSPISIITGGPGTGKTMIQKFILEIYQEAQAFRIRRLLCTNRKSGTAHGAGNRTIGLYNSQGAGSACGC